MRATNAAGHRKKLIPKIGRRLSMLLMVIPVLFLALGCSSAEASPPIKSCKNYEPMSKYGHFTITQPGKGKTIRWGVYPKESHRGTSYPTYIYVDGKMFDMKRQATQFYPPHGSIDATTARKNSGKILRISGKIYHLSDLVFVYNMQCRIM